MKAKNKGVTLVALMITVIVVLILAAVSIAGLTGDNGILSKTQEAKTQTEIADEKEMVEIAAMNALGKGRINERNMAEELDKNPGKGKYSLVSSEQKVYVTFEDSKRTYLVESDGEVEEYNTKL